MSLISGKEAWIAKSENKEVQYIVFGFPNWECLSDKEFMSWDTSRFLSKSTAYKFRLKPQTITINGIEVPAPFKPTKGDNMWHLCTDFECGYAESTVTTENINVYFRMGAWRTQEEIKQVVAALREVFK